MAKATVKLPDDLLLKLSTLGNRTDSVTESVLKAGGEVMLEAVREELQSVIGRDTAEPSRSTGELVSSLGLSPVKLDKDGNADIKVGFAEPRRQQNQAKGKRSYYESTNAMIANVLEHGKHGQPAKPFFKPAFRKAKNDCVAAMEAKFDEEVGKL